MSNVRVFLTRRNIRTLLEKLDFVAEGGESACTIIKYDSNHPEYPMTGASVVAITVIEDEDYYTDRDPGLVHDMKTGEIK